MSKFIPIQEVVNLPMLGERDYLKRSKGRFLTWSKYVWEDMNMSSVKIARREIYEINKRTNTVQLPCDTIQLCSVSVIDKCGNFYPVYRNNRLHDDMVDIGAARDCSCEHKCGYKMCNTIKGYEAVVSTKCDYNPNGDKVSFECVDRKVVDANGFLYEQLQYPQRVYHSGVWMDTVLYTENKKLCKVEVDENGCCKDTPENIEAVCSSCGIHDAHTPVGGTANCPPAKGVKKWIYYCNNKADWFGLQCGGYPLGYNCEYNNIYNISELQDRLIFPQNFGFDRVMIRRYADVDLNKLQIPFIAVDTFVMGLKWWDCKYDDKRQNLAANYGRQYALMKFGLLRELNKYRIEELGKILAPVKHIPSYVLGTPGFSVWQNGLDWGGEYIVP